MTSNLILVASEALYAKQLFLCHDHIFDSSTLHGLPGTPFMLVPVASVNNPSHSPIRTMLCCVDSTSLQVSRIFPR